MELIKKLNGLSFRRMIAVILAMLLVMSMAACALPGSSANPTEPTEAPTQPENPTETPTDAPTEAPTEPEPVEVQLPDVSIGVRVYAGAQKVNATYTVAPLALFEDGVTGVFSIECDDDEISIEEIDGTYFLRITSLGDKHISVTRTVGAQKTIARFCLKVEAQIDNQLFNGGFEGDELGWLMTEEEKAAYPVYNSPVDIWGNPVGFTDNYLYGYAGEAFANANFRSSLFKVGGSGMITWRMAGNCTEDLQFILMQYNPEGDDVEIAKFNNWYFGTVAESGFISHQYYYQIDTAKYADSYCYFVVKDTMSEYFAFICLDDIVTYYEAAPDTSAMLQGGFCVKPDSDPKGFGSDLTNVGNQLINGDFENGYENWYLTEEEKAAYPVYNSPVDIWNNPVGFTNNYLYGYAGESFANANFYSGLFKVGGSGYITWKMAGNCTEQLQFILMQYNPQGDDVEIAKFNNWYFGTVAESGFISHQYYYQFDMSKYSGAYCYFVVKDTMSSNFAFICLDDIVTYYETAPDTSAMLQGSFCVAPVSSDPDAKDFGDLSNVGNQLVNGDFENGYENWYMTDEEKAAYTIYDSTVDIWNNPIQSNGNYLYGFANESFANANFHSGLFKVGGSGMITWKMAGNCTDNLEVVLMCYNPNGQDTEIAKFNNWYFGEYGYTGFLFHTYYYQIDMTQYADAYCYFVVKDTATGNFGFICLDDIVTYYAETPDVSTMQPAGFCVKPAA